MASECLLYTKRYSESWDKAQIKTNTVTSKAEETVGLKAEWGPDKVGWRVIF